MAKKKKAGAKKTSKVAKKKAKTAKKKTPARGARRPAAKKKVAKKAVKKAAPKAAKKATRKAAPKKAPKAAAKKVRKPVRKPAAPRPPKPAPPPPEELRPYPEETGLTMPGFEEPGPGGASVLDVESEMEEGPTLYEPDEPRSEEEGEEEEDDEDSPRGRRRASHSAPAAAQHAGSPSAHAQLRPGMPAPDFALSDETGEMHTLASYRGRRVVLYFYPKDNTPGCTREACGFRDALDEFESRNAVVLGVSPDASESHAAFAKKYRLTFPLLADESHAAAERYGAWGEKRGSDGQLRLGILRSSFVIDEAGRIAQVFRQVNPAGHEQEILDFLDQMPWQS